LPICESVIRYQAYSWISPEYWYFIIAIYTFFWTCLLTNSYFLIKIIKFLRSFRDSYDDTQSEYYLIIKNVIKKLYVLPIITFFMWFFATINRSYEILCYFWSMSHGKAPYSMAQSRQILYTIQVVIMSSKGLIYALVYCRYNKINEQFYKLFGKLCCRKPPQQTEASNSLI
jgi:hypothetical protein